MPRVVHAEDVSDLYCLWGGVHGIYQVSDKYVVVSFDFAGRRAGYTYADDATLAKYRSSALKASNIGAAFQELEEVYSLGRLTESRTMSWIHPLATYFSLPTTILVALGTVFGLVHGLRIVETLASEASPKAVRCGVALSLFTARPMTLMILVTAFQPAFTRTRSVVGTSDLWNKHVLAMPVWPAWKHWQMLRTFLPQLWAAALLAGFIFINCVVDSLLENRTI